MMEFILDLDQEMFLYINRTFTSGWMDAFLPLVRDKLFWIPFYVFILSFIFFNFKWQRIIYAILLIAVTMGVADTMSSKVIKPAVARDRPCNDWELEDYVIERARCGGGKSFTSSHATNHFALAMVLFHLFAGIVRYRWPIFLWAGVISYAQVYVGVHYPLDVICGGLLGITIGWLASRTLDSIWRSMRKT